MISEIVNTVKEWRMKRNTLMIVADIKSGKLLVSYKGKSASGGFTDNTLRNMVNGVRFDKNLENCLIAIGKLINQVKK